MTGEMITLDNPPIPGKQSHAKGSHIPLVQPVEYSSASWRRALMSLEEHQKAWLLWNYSENVRWCYQVEITQWAWAEFREQLGAKKVAGKTMERLKKLVWLAAQDVKAELAGREMYEYQALASLVGVTPKTGQRPLLTAGLRCAASSCDWIAGLYCRLRDHVHNKRRQI